MPNEKYEKIIDYFDGHDIVLPTEVKLALEDVFHENDSIDDVYSYHGKNELGAFQEDLRLSNDVRIYLDGKSVGSIMNSYTYAGQVDFSLSEHVTLIKKDEKTGTEEIIEKIVDIDRSNVDSMVYNEREYNVILIETVTWNTPGEPERNNTLYIYCPEELPEELGGDDE